MISFKQYLEEASNEQLIRDGLHLVVNNGFSLTLKNNCIPMMGGYASYANDVVNAALYALHGAGKRFFHTDDSTVGYWKQSYDRLDRFPPVARSMYNRIVAVGKSTMA